MDESLEAVIEKNTSLNFGDEQTPFDEEDIEEEVQRLLKRVERECEGYKNLHLKSKKSIEKNIKEYVSRGFYKLEKNVKKENCLTKYDFTIK